MNKILCRYQNIRLSRSVIYTSVNLMSSRVEAFNNFLIFSWLNPSCKKIQAIF